MKIAIVGDIHGEFKGLSYQVNNFIEDCTHIISVGDFGYFPNTNVDFKPLEDIKQPIFFCDGNHENHEALKNLDDNEVLPNVFYQKRGSVLRLGDTNFLFMGGATSIDADWRTPGYDWFPEEDISIRDMNSLPDDVKVDVVISHTCPTEVDVPKVKPLAGTITNRRYLSHILQKYSPKLWFFGHWHQKIEQQVGNTKFYGLNRFHDKGWLARMEIGVI